MTRRVHAHLTSAYLLATLILLSTGLAASGRTMDRTSDSAPDATITRTPVPGDPVVLGLAVIRIDCFAIGLDRGGHIVDAFHPSFDFKRGNSAFDEGGNMVNHAQIA